MNRTIRATHRMILTAMLLAWASVPSMAQNPAGNPAPSFGVGLGGGGLSSCIFTIHEVRNNWFEVKRHMAPDSRGMRPAIKEFACVSPMVARESLEITISPASGLRCFTYHDGRVFCCNERLSECTIKPE